MSRFRGALAFPIAASWMLCGLACDQASSPAQRRAEATAPATSPDRDSPEPLIVVSWNVQKCEEGLEPVAARLARLAPRVIALQELIEPPGGLQPSGQTAEIAARLGMHSVSECGALDDRRNQCIALLSIDPLSNKAPLRTRDDRAYAVAADITRDGGVVRFACVHLTGTWQADWTHVGETAARREEEIADLAKWLSGQTVPIVLLGDFNPIGADAVEQLTRHVATVDGIGSTFPREQPALPLDRVFHSRQLRIVAAEALDLGVSDHRAVRCELVPADR